MVDVPVVFLDDDLGELSYQHEGDAGSDLVARIGVQIEPRGGRALVPTGLAMAIPEGHAGLVLPRSGLALRHGVTCLNAPGLIDSGFRGEIQVVLVNTDNSDSYEVKRGDRIAQLLIVPFTTINAISVAELPPSSRGPGGFGHTGR